MPMKQPLGGGDNAEDEKGFDLDAGGQGSARSMACDSMLLLGLTLQHECPLHGDE